jgi:hypothetical protein
MFGVLRLCYEQLHGLYRKTSSSKFMDAAMPRPSQSFYANNERAPSRSSPTLSSTAEKLTNENFFKLFSVDNERVLYADAIVMNSGLWDAAYALIGDYYDDHPQNGRRNTDGNDNEIDDEIAGNADRDIADVVVRKRPDDDQDEEYDYLRRRLSVVVNHVKRVVVDINERRRQRRWSGDVNVNAGDLRVIWTTSNIAVESKIVRSPRFNENKIMTMPRVMQVDAAAVDVFQQARFEVMDRMSYAAPRPFESTDGWHFHKYHYVTKAMANGLVHRLCISDNNIEDIDDYIQEYAASRRGSEEL